jgi:hypothetical protein
MAWTAENERWRSLDLELYANAVRRSVDGSGVQHRLAAERRAIANAPWETTK